MSISGLAKLNHNLPSSSVTETGVKKRSIPQCALCRNHGFNVLYRGHKRKCRYALCVCTKCLLTKERRRVMSWQVYEQRAAASNRGPDTLPLSLGGSQPQEHNSTYWTSSDSFSTGVAGRWSSPPPGFQALMPYPQQPIASPIPTYHHHHQFQHFRPAFVEPYDGRSYPYMPSAPPNSPYGLGLGGMYEERSQYTGYPNYHPPDPTDWSQENSCGPQMYPYQSQDR